jgi:hypothetical protein
LTQNELPDKGVMRMTGSGAKQPLKTLVTASNPATGSIRSTIRQQEGDMDQGISNSGANRMP